MFVFLKFYFKFYLDFNFQSECKEKIKKGAIAKRDEMFDKDSIYFGEISQLNTQSFSILIIMKVR